MALIQNGGQKGDGWVAEILQAYRSGAARPEDIVARSYARIRAHGDPAMFIRLRDEAEATRRSAGLPPAGETSLPLYGIPVAVKDNIDVERPADHGGLSGLRLSARARTPPAWQAARRRRDHHRQDQPRPVRDRPGRRALALRHAAQHCSTRAHPGRLEQGLGVRGRARARAAFARHRYGRLGPRAGGVQQHRRLQAEPRPRFDRGRGAGLPHARLRLGVRADGRRRWTACSKPSPGRIAADAYSRGRAARTRRAVAGRAAARRAARRPAAVLRRSHVGRSL